MYMSFSVGSDMLFVRNTSSLMLPYPLRSGLETPQSRSAASHVAVSYINHMRSPLVFRTRSLLFHLP